MVEAEYSEIVLRCETLRMVHGGPLILKKVKHYIILKDVERYAFF